MLERGRGSQEPTIGSQTVRIVVRSYISSDEFSAREMERGSPEMDAPRIKATADAIVRATAGLPSAKAINGLMTEYVSEESRERRLVILRDVYSCLAQDMGVPNDTPAGETNEVPGVLASSDPSPAESTTWGSASRHQETACSFCELVHEFYPAGSATTDRQTLISEHLARRHGVRLDSKKINR